MAGRHINKRKRETSAEDEWAHITNLGDDIGKSIEIADAMDVQDRTITFGKNLSESATNYEFYEEEKERMKDEVGNTAQYLKFVNESIKEKKERLDSFFENQRKLEEDIDALQGYKPKTREKLNQIKYKDIKVSDIERTIHYLEKDREEIRKKMEHFATQVSHSQMDLIEKDKEIAEVKAEMQIALKRDTVRKQKEEDPIDVLKNHLQNVGNGEESKKVLEAIGSLVSQLKKDDSADLQSILKNLTKD
jgi:uncharacterized protein (DUF3084 family)